MADKITDLDIIRRQVEQRRQEEAQRRGSGGGDVELPSGFVRACLRTNMHGDSELFKALHRGRFVYCKSMATWLRWAGHHWEIDHMGRAEAAVEAVADAYEDYAAEVKAEIASDTKRSGNKDQWRMVNQLERRAEQLRGDARRQGCLKFAHTSDNPMAIEGSELDTRPWDLPCPNGVINLRDGSFRDGRPEDYNLKATKAPWEGFDAPRDKWLQAVTEIMAGETDMVDFLQRIFGMAIVGKVSEKVFPVLTGPGGDNGKTIIIEGISYALGPMAGPIQSEMLVAGWRTNSSGPSPDIMSLKGLRLAYASETEDGARISAARVKLFTGKDSLTGRWPHDKFATTFDPSHTLMLLSNFKPKADSQDKAFWSRMINIPFRMRFLKNREPVGENERAADIHLDEALRKQGSGILAWLVEGCLTWQQHGLMIPIRVQREGEDYQSGEDDMGAFIEYCCFADAGSAVGATELYNIFCKWWKRFVGNFPPKQKKFGGYLRERYRFEKSGGVYQYYGLAVNAASVSEFDPDYSRAGWP